MLKTVKLILIGMMLVVSQSCLANIPDWIVKVTHGRVGLERAQQISDSVYDAANKYSVEPNIIFQIIKYESMYNARAIGGGHNFGLMQLNMRYHRARFKGGDPLDVEDNIDAGTQYYSENLKKCKGNNTCALAGYNSGRNKHIYAKKVLSVKLF